MRQIRTIPPSRLRRATSLYTREALQGISNSNIKSDICHIAVSHDIFLTFAAEQALFLGDSHGAAGLKILESYDFGTDETALKVGMDLSGRLRCLGATGDGPGANLVLTAGAL